MGMKVQKNNKGFTLVEVICAVTIMMLVVVPIFTGFLMAAKTNAAIGDKLEINMMLENELEAIKAEGKLTNVTGYTDDVPLGDRQKYNELNPVDDITKFEKSISSNGVDYPILITVQAVPLSDNDDTIAYYTIILVYSVTDEGDGQTEEYTVEGVYAPW